MGLKQWEVENLMQQAGWAWLRIRVPGHTLDVHVANWVVEEDKNTAYGYTEVVNRRSIPTSREIYLMDEANNWLSLIKDRTTRRVVAMRMLYDDDRGRCIHSYMRISKEVRSSVSIVRNRYDRGVSEITRWLNKNNDVLSKITLYLPPPKG